MRVSESAIIGSLVHTARATDADCGRNAEIMYSIVSGNERGMGNDIKPATSTIIFILQIRLEFTAVVVKYELIIYWIKN